MTRILFVDDEPAVLDGVRRTLRAERGWQLEFAESGRAALQRLAAASFDVVVADMRMPDMDGAALLDAVMREHPQVVRILLSGQADQATVVRSLGESTHQYIAKPVDPAALKGLLGRVCALRSLLRSDALSNLVSGMQSLPSLPTIYTKLLNECRSPRASFDSVGRIISQDPALTAKLLQVMNSALYGVGRPISNPVQAVSLLGLETVTGLVLSAHVFSATKTQHLAADRLWQHSTMTSAFARRIAQAERPDDDGKHLVDDASMAGILHDAGKLVLAANLPDQYGEMLALAARENLSQWDAEMLTFGATHAEVGAYLLGLWALPESIVEAVAFHHHPRQPLNHRFTALTAVHAANVIANEVHPPDMGAPSTVDPEYLGDLKLTEHFPRWRNTCLALLRHGGRR